MQVLYRLDPWDWAEVEAARGAPVNHLQLFADWRAMEPLRLGSWVVTCGPGREAFALLSLSVTGQAGVAAAALLARDHLAFRMPLGRLAVMIRAGLGDFCAGRGVRRIEARAWARHPRAATILAAAGFTHETDMPGFGPDGSEIFRQFAWLSKSVASPSETGN